MELQIAVIMLIICIFVNNHSLFTVKVNHLINVKESIYVFI